MEQKSEAFVPDGVFCVREANQTELRPAVPDIVLRPDFSLRKARLAEVISGEIVPRLLRIHQQSHPVPASVTQAEIVEFAGLAMAADNRSAAAYFDQMRAKGHSLDTLFVHFLAPTARYLGELWEQDLCDFVDVTIGVSRLQELLTIFGSGDDDPLVEHNHRALLLTLSGERHLFGLDMVAKLMRNAGWHVTVVADASPREAAAMVAREWFGIVGVTLSSEAGLGLVARTIEALRHASLNASLSVLVGGPAFNDEPGRAVQAGADGLAVDAIAAVILSKKLLIEQAGKKSARRGR
jgi:methanogenic corrinoid protein MtbC1